MHRASMHVSCSCLPLLSASSPLLHLLYSAGHQQEGSPHVNLVLLKVSVACRGGSDSGFLESSQGLLLTLTDNKDDLA